jgi:hypothetical protein
VRIKPLALEDMLADLRKANVNVAFLVPPLGVILNTDAITVSQKSISEFDNEEWLVSTKL